MSFKKNLLMLVLGGWLSTFSQLDAQIRRPGSENDSKPVLPAPPTSSSQPNQNKTVVQTNTSPSNPNQTNNNTGTNNIISPSASNTVSSQTPTVTNLLNSQFYIGTEIMVGVSNHTTNYSGIKIATADGIESQYGFYSGGGFEAILTYSQGVRIGFKF